MGFQAEIRHYGGKKVLVCAGVENAEDRHSAVARSRREKCDYVFFGNTLDALDDILKPHGPQQDGMDSLLGPRVQRHTGNPMSDAVQSIAATAVEDMRNDLAQWHPPDDEVCREPGT